MLHRAHIPPLALLAAVLTGCASPGLPHAPSLNLPAPVQKLTAERLGPLVTLRFTAPHRTTDNLPIRTSTLGLRVCRELPPSTACTTIPQLPNSISTLNPQGTPNTITLTDTLPIALSSGPPRLLAYRVELLNDRGHSAGYSDPAYTAAGQAPPPVENFTASGSRLGVILAWSPAPEDGSQLFLRRETVTPPASPSKHSEPLLLRATDAPAARQPDRTLDTSAEDATPYRYTAYRERSITLGGRTLTERSATTPPLAFTLHDTFPPPVPTDLTAAPFTTEGAFSVDLIWQPVEDPGLLGYNVYREDLTAQTPRTKLNPTPLPTPAFHDTTAAPTARYRYSVTSIDRKGNESSPITTTIDPN